MTEGPQPLAAGPRRASPARCLSWLATQSFSTQLECRYGSFAKVLMLKEDDKGGASCHMDNVELDSSTAGELVITAFWGTLAVPVFIHRSYRKIKAFIRRYGEGKAAHSSPGTVNQMNASSPICPQVPVHRQEEGGEAPGDPDYVDS
ncbi:hypothetical protein P7K49_009108 [Saguinus oedipus]|uniref:Uncharacterized protein n=1 Tax=Saguinus oedipus TaxID=9490 RepID=A0ABQ9VZM9_SAGOE|nr:hypothetical protein P7K49_009108 [Saguinus oedipus]